METKEIKSKFKKYSEYRDSGEYWMGQIPSHWKILKLKFLFYEKKIVHDTTLNCGSISFGKVVYKNDKSISLSTKASYQVLSRGEFLLNPLNLNYDLKSLRIGLSDIDAVVSSGYIILKNRVKLNKTYYKYLLHIYDVTYMKLLGSGVRQTINFSNIAISLLTFPPLSEQTAIANFLDKKTKEIDQAISSKEKLISLLQERKRIVIQNAVTHGLNPNVKLKDSGVEWIGMIPEHWDCIKLKYFFYFDKGLTITKENLKEFGIPCLNYGEIHSKFGFEINPKINKLKYVSEDYLKTSSKSLLTYGNFIFADTSEDLEGSGNFTYLNSNMKTFAGYHTIIVRAIKNINSRFFAYVFDSLSFRNQVRNQVKGVKVYSITQTMLKNLTISIPSEKEQEIIVNYLDNQRFTISQTISNQRTLITKLKEYKQTLIDSAVTGKIKIN